MTMRRKPKRLFRTHPSHPAIPPAVEALRGVRSAVTPWETYRLRLPDGHVEQATGAELIDLADAMTALADADRRGDRDGMRRALRKLNPAPELPHYADKVAALAAAEEARIQPGTVS